MKQDILAEEECPLLLTQRVMSGKWKLSILWFLAKYGTLRFSELKRDFDDPTLTQKMLTQHLRELESDQIVKRIVYDEVPPHVEYSLTELGKGLAPIIDQMENWGKGYMEAAKKSHAAS